MSAQESTTADAPRQRTCVQGDSDRRPDDRSGWTKARRTRAQWWAAAAWAGAAVALFAFFVRISFSGRVNSDGANNALQAWDLVHGHLRLHGWRIGDATFYFFELPLNGVLALLFGLGDLASHLASAMTYLIVAAVAVSLAVLGGRGPSRAVRCAVVVAVLAAPLLSVPAVRVLLEEPDHIGTSMFILLPFLLIDRWPSRRFTAPLVGVILVAGQFSDLTVRYVAVPAIVAVSLYRLLATRGLRCADAAMAVAAIASVPLEDLFRALMTRLGAFYMVPPKTRLSPSPLWPPHASVTWLDIRVLFGAAVAPGTRVSRADAALGLVGLAVALAGLARVAWTWRRASRAEQLLSAAIVCNVAVYIISVMPLPDGSREIAVLLPAGAVLAARCVPGRVTGKLVACAAVTATAAFALLPLVVSATRPPTAPVSGPAAGAATAPLAAWLRAHRLRYGIAGYWDASVTTVQSGDAVELRSVDLHPPLARAPQWTINVSSWESNPLWYDPSRYDATFAVADARGRYPVAAFEKFFGRPAARYRVKGWYVLVYRTNLLGPLLPVPQRAASRGPQAKATAARGATDAGP